MRAFVRNHKTVAAVIGIVVLFAAWLLSAPIRGYLVASIDVARGHYELQTFGLLAEWSPEYARLLRERYHVEHRIVAGCVVGPSLVSYVKAYNSVSTEAAKRKFGRNVFRECSADARKAWIQQGRPKVLTE